MKKEGFKFRKYIMVLTGILLVMTGSKAWGAGSVLRAVSEKENIREPETAHYAKLAQLDGRPQPGQATLDAQTFPLSEWGPLYSWKLFKTYYADKPIEAFREYQMPANSSKRTRAELDYMLELQRTRTPEELAWCLKIADIYYNPMIVNPADKQYKSNRDNLFYIGRNLGSWFSREELPLTTDLLSKVIHDSMVYMVEFKLKYARPRPYQLETNLKVDKHLPHGSFPSGHSFNSYVNAELLSRLAPDRREDLMKSAQEFAWSRELLGVHYPSDSEASRIWAGEFVNFLFDNQRFVEDFELAKKEWAQKRSK